MAFNIETIHAFLSVDEDGCEGVVAILDKKTEMWMPLISGDSDRLKSMEVAAMHIKKETGETIRLVKFSTREVIKTL